MLSGGWLMQKGVVLLSILNVSILLASCSHSSGRNRRYTTENNQLSIETSITVIGKPDTDNCDSLSKKNSFDSAYIICKPAPLSLIPEQLIEKSSYIVSYNNETKIPNWVAWHLTADHTDGPVRRMSSFYEEESVDIPRATIDDYRGSGWSRGHMCPAGDNKWNETAMYDSFSLVNVCPQNANLNSGLWNSLEIDCRRWAKHYVDIYIVCGPVFLNREHETIGVNKVFVPEAFFKVVLCLNGIPKGLGVIVRNTDGNKKRNLYYNSIDQVERITGYDFFPALPDSIEDKVEAYANIKDW